MIYPNMIYQEKDAMLQNVHVIKLFKLYSVILAMCCLVKNAPKFKCVV